MPTISPKRGLPVRVGARPVATRADLSAAAA
jgi:hypothetical protein